VLRFGAWDQHVGRDLEIEAPEFLVAGQILHRSSLSAARDESEIRLPLVAAEQRFGMRVDPGAIALRDVQQQQLGRECG
jgi:hypothetical protein